MIDVLIIDDDEVDRASLAKQRHQRLGEERVGDGEGEGTADRGGGEASTAVGGGGGDARDGGSGRKRV